MFRTAFLFTLLLLPNLALAQTFNVSTTAQLRSAFENAAVHGEDDSLGIFKFSDTEAHRRSK